MHLAAARLAGRAEIAAKAAKRQKTKELELLVKKHMIQKFLSSSIMPFSSSNHFLYFAFGSNLLTERIHIKNPSAKFKCVAKLDRYKLAFNHFSEVSII